MVFILVWWVADARFWFKGPKYVYWIFFFLFSALVFALCFYSLSDSARVNIEHRMLGDEVATLDGVVQERGESSTDMSMRDDDKVLDGDEAGRLA